MRLNYTRHRYTGRIEIADARARVKRAVQFYKHIPSIFSDDKNSLYLGSYTDFGMLPIPLLTKVIQHGVACLQQVTREYIEGECQLLGDEVQKEWFE